ncbi:recombinase family protein [Brevibacillus sp. MER 51]|uniref:recombinase family protein n=1 Tax=Brevibacillus sp. MER 51 TaxID=2939560 RepID=UPI00203CF834|nr:recombinase family protein [Brevibacillus sp. MER 51]MCM3143914.1 recombinase family protein [Brevibacillus sp. MER 51]
MVNNKLVAIYIRTNTTQDQCSLELQKSNGLDIAKKISGQDVTFEMYMGEGISGIDSEPINFQRMLHDIHIGKVTAVVSHSVSRISRCTSSVTEFLQQMKKLNTLFKSVKESENHSTFVNRNSFIMKTIRKHWLQ